MNEIGVLYEAVSVEKELPEMGKKVFTIEYPTHPVMEGTVKSINYRSDVNKSSLSKSQKQRIEDNNNFIHGSLVTHWLRPLPSHVPISVERLEALEKCVEALHNILSVKCYDNLKALGDVGVIAREALANLNKQ